MNFELYILFQELNRIPIAKAHRLRWAGHLERMYDNRLPKRIIDSKSTSKRPLKRNRARRIEYVTNDLKDLSVVKGYRECESRRMLNLLESPSPIYI